MEADGMYERPASEYLRPDNEAWLVVDDDDFLADFISSDEFHQAAFEMLEIGSFVDLEFVPEPGNPGRPRAVAIDVSGQRIGYLSADLAAYWHDYIRAINRRGIAVNATGRVARIERPAGISIEVEVVLPGFKSLASMVADAGLAGQCDAVLAVLSRHDLDEWAAGPWGEVKVAWAERLESWKSLTPDLTWLPAAGRTADERIPPLLSLRVRELAGKLSNQSLQEPPEPTGEIQSNPDVQPEPQSSAGPLMAQGMDFTAVDFNTATDNRGSVVSAGIVKVVQGEVVSSQRISISPPEGSGADPVPGADTWLSAYTTIMDIAQGDIFISHGSSLSMSVLLNACSLEDIDWPEVAFGCTMELSRQMLSLPSNSLPWVTDNLGIRIVDESDPLERAKAAADIFMALTKRSGFAGVSDLLAAAPTARTATIFEDAGDADEAQALIGAELRGQYVCFTGALKTMTRKAAQGLVTEHGGTAQADVTAKTTIVVTGDFDPSTFRPGAKFSTKLQKAMDMAAKGMPVEILSEDDFFSRLAVTREELQRHAASFKRVKLPDYIVQQAERHDPASEDYWSWFRRMLQHPSGRAVEGDPCIWCAGPISGRCHWVYRDRHVCSGGCNNALKRSAKRSWAKHGISY